MFRYLLNEVRSTWSSTRYRSEELTRFAAGRSVKERRLGLSSMSLLCVLLLGAEGLMYRVLELDPLYWYSCIVLMLLAGTVFFASRAVDDPKALHLLGITLLTVSGTAFALLAHYQQAFHPMIFASIALLFVVVPMMSWGVREALVVMSIIYAMFTLSTLGARFNFTEQSLWTLQFIMLGTGLVGLLLVARNVSLRKHDIETQFNLVMARDRITRLSNRDPLTGAWNRRFFDSEFGEYLKERRSRGEDVHFMLLDIDDFKTINDTNGHTSGDRVLKRVRDAFSYLVSDIGRFVRMGGDEFAVVFSGVDPNVIAGRGIERLRQFSRAGKYPEEKNVTLSIGVASVPADVEIGQQQFYRQADLALYKAKENKSADSSLNIVVSRLSNPADVHLSTSQLWRPAAKDAVAANDSAGADRVQST